MTASTAWGAQRGVSSYPIRSPASTERSMRSPSRCARGFESSVTAVADALAAIRVFSVERRYGGRKYVATAEWTSPDTRHSARSRTWPDLSEAPPQEQVASRSLLVRTRRLQVRRVGSSCPISSTARLLRRRVDG